MKVAIVGGGIGGLSTAIALARSGFEVEVFERHAERNGLGGGIVCWPNACFVLEKLGVLTDAMEVSGAPMAMHRVSHEGETLGTLDIAVLKRKA